ncbi:AAA family ATPase [Oceanivirga miroungae]|uniref:Aerobic cobaltochelatase subunit CobS n=1 Tax=Oceanivirga miroungae TaxID=1130046 RepID=A0A6I8MEK8_9FUSO|nr:AAA family ATPase [Oceanivirga miroungae]VWL85953.1 Aerobic cobaltochelatase subunit CobS [Oceanivirga miroungae]
MVNLSKRAYKVRRENKEIYKGFGFMHLSDATNYYIHKNNQSIQLKTTLAQAIGEAINFHYDIINFFNFAEYEEYGNIYILEDGGILLYFNVINTYKLYDIFPNNFDKVIVKIDNKDNISINILDSNEKILSFDEYYSVMLGNLALFTRHILTTDIFDDEMSDFLLKDSIEFSTNPTASLFVKIHENFYQFYKFNEFNINTVDKIDINNENIIEDLGKETYSRKEKTEIKINKDDILSFDCFDEMLIPNLSDTYIIDPKIVPLGNAIVNGDAISTLFYGPSGTGKTIACKLLCQQMKLPILSVINCSENIDEFILGKYIPIDDKIVFRESEISKAIRDGGAVIFEEINFSKPQHLAFLNSLLDTNGFVRLDNGEIIRRHKNFRFFATMNIGYYGTRELNQALFNRFNIVCEIEKLEKSSIVHMLKTKVPECSQNIESILNIYYKIQMIIKKEELEYIISPRNLENWAKLAKYMGYIKAADVTIIPIVKEDEYYKAIFKELIFKEKWV